jgi:hypothetical protein
MRLVNVRLVESSGSGPTQESAGQEARLVGKGPMSPFVPFAAREPPEFCERRGHHGPYVNAERYLEFPGWDGMGECLACGSTVRIRTDLPTPPDP